MKKIIFFFALVLASFSFAKAFHPYHVGVVEGNYNPQTRKLEIITKLYEDDFEKVLKSKYERKIKFSDASQKEKLEELVQKYFQENLLIKINGKVASQKLIGFEIEKGIINIYTETEEIDTPKKIDMNVSLLYEGFKEQMNMIHITVNGVRKSGKLTHPSTYIYQLF